MNKTLLTPLTVSAILLLSVVMSGACYAQSCQVQRAVDGGSYMVTIDGRQYQAFPVDNPRDTLIAVTTSQMRKFLNRDDASSIALSAERKRSAAKDSLIAQLDKTVDACVSNARAQDTLLQSTTTLYHGYKDLYQTLKRNFSEPWLMGSAGVGAMRESGDNGAYIPAILFGISIHKIGVWGFISSEQSGFLVGINSPIDFSIF